MRIRLVAGATLALMAMSIVAGCTTSDAPSPEPTSTAETQEPTTTPTPTPTPSLDPAAARDNAIQACTMIAEKNFVEPGVQDVLKDAANLANDAAEADSHWDSLAQYLSLLAVGYILREANPQPFDETLPLADAQCDAVGVSLVG
jgi:hypothetical protein